MKIVNVNGEIGYPKKTMVPGRTAEELIRRMDVDGVDECVAYHHIAVRQIQEGNAEMKLIAEASGGRLKPCYFVHPRLDGVQMPKAADLLEELRRDRPAAVTMHPADHGYPLDKLYCGELMEVLQELQIPVLLDNRSRVPEFMTRIPTIAKEFPKVPIVVNEVTYTTTMFNYVCMKETENILLGIGGMGSFGELDHLVNTFGGHRFVVSSTAGCISAGALGMVYLGRFSQEDKDLILGGNWQRLQEEIKWA